MIFKRSQDGRPYPEPEQTDAEWAALPVQSVLLRELVTIKRVVGIEELAGDLAGRSEQRELRVVAHDGELFLESGLHIALRAAMQLRSSLPARVLVLK